MEIISKLGIDLNLILAQVVSFLILFFILRKLLYRPILNLLDKRQKMIAKSVENSEKIEKRLEQIELDREKIMKEASAVAMQALEKAKQESEGEKQKMLATAKKEISTLAERYRTQLRAEKDEMFSELKSELAGLIVSSCEKILRKEFTKDDEKRLENAIKNEIATL